MINPNNRRKLIKPLIGLNGVVLGAIATTLGIGAFAEVALADPLADPQTKFPRLRLLRTSLAMTKIRPECVSPVIVN